MTLILSYIMLHFSFWLREKVVDICDRLFYWIIIPLTCILAICLWGWITWESGLYAFRTHGVHGLPNSTMTLEIKFPNGTVANAGSWITKAAYEFFVGVPLKEKGPAEAEKVFKAWKDKWDQEAKANEKDKQDNAAKKPHWTNIKKS
jgi:hypothetical protein